MNFDALKTKKGRAKMYHYHYSNVDDLRAKLQETLKDYPDQLAKEYIDLNIEIKSLENKHAMTVNNSQQTKCSSALQFLYDLPKRR